MEHPGQLGLVWVAEDMGPILPNTGNEVMALQKLGVISNIP